jgi:hypothetical protein
LRDQHPAILVDERGGGDEQNSHLRGSPFKTGSRR